MMPLQRHRGAKSKYNRHRSENPKVWRIPCLGARETIRRHSELDGDDEAPVNVRCLTLSASDRDAAFSVSFLEKSGRDVSCPTRF
jgi:hypothetical protein